MTIHQISAELARLIARINFDSERYYTLYFESPEETPPADLTSETWASVGSVTADVAKLRGEVSRLRRGVEQLKLPAIEAVGLDRVAEQLRSLEFRLRPLGEILSRPEDEGELKRLLKDMLGVVDALERVFELMEQQPETISEGVQRGLRSLQQLLADTLGRHGLREIDTGGKFDPHVHMAMGTEPKPGKPEGSISRVMLKGYFLGEQVFRTAQVVLVKNSTAGGS